MNIKSFFQRGKRGYSDMDIWGLDYYLAGVISKTMRELEKTRHGYPSTMSDKQWTKILLAIADGFEAYIEQENCFEKSQAKQLKNKYNKGMKLFSQYFEGLWD